VRPLDWDNYRLKDLQDCLVHAGLLAGDEWNILEGSVVSCKAHTKAEEKTEIEIT
jgi:Holliday junction resolvase RusA-like endonuclease